MRRSLGAFVPFLFACAADPGPARAPQPAPTASPTLSPLASASAPAPTENLPEAPLLLPVDVARFDAAVGDAIDRGEVPGALLAVVRGGRVVLRKAYGLREKEPAAAPMTPDAVFDLASLTKPIATAASVLLLAERKKLRLSDPVSRHLPDFDGDGRERVTVEDLLLHVSGLPAADAIAGYGEGKERALARILRTRLVHPPGAAFLYSDLGYLLLGEIVARVSGEPLEEFARKNLFEPLGMADTVFRPPAALQARAVPSERSEGRMLKGEVHDPRARALGGVAGHAGLFSTADDLTRFVRMIAGGGAIDGRRVLAAETVLAMTTLRPLPSGEKGAADKMHALAFGPMFNGVGHTGFTGTALWLDPRRGDAVILLASRLHPDGKGEVRRLRREVAEIAATLGEIPKVRTGIDVLEVQGFRPLAGRRIGLITNHTGKNAGGQRTIDLLFRAKNLKLVAIFTPEHGLGGDVDRAIGDGVDKPTGLPVHSLYGKTRRPTEEQLAGIDTLVYDLQDAGARFYTYTTTLGYALEEAGRRKMKVVVLDRPNPIGGLAVEGPLLDPGRESFIGYHAIPVRHGMTLGELGRLFNAERKIGADLEVIRMEGWRRADRFERTGLPWVNPSPNLRSPVAALLYPGLGLLELTDVSVGRGTDKPFERVGAPWMDGERLAKALAEENLAGLEFAPIRFTPGASAHAGKACGGVAIEVTDPDRVEPVRLGLAVARALRRLHATEWQPGGVMTLLGNRRVFDAIVRDASVPEMMALYEGELRAFVERRRAFLLY
ncbi:exo-beta-N-acetylmuramidase NamZ domain-containing protein [Polyangium aurulentum]|uniref:exo-beta-N-acetylmuramidase NamZ domain-containing protein n=1 Tax=Polyangium aurulentum TaxID=2567896 RepID=UPI00146DFE46|nr:exo-beta-N-acetylmuramidase NamZ domain-containing protein [Polyangium aurulentum]UQA62610.1 DUF1343 domain-containing protein [Polyangium aurulentum]